MALSTSLVAVSCTRYRLCPSVIECRYQFPFIGYRLSFVVRIVSCVVSFCLPPLVGDRLPYLVWFIVSSFIVPFCFVSYVYIPGTRVCSIVSCVTTCLVVSNMYPRCIFVLSFVFFPIHYRIVLLYHSSLVTFRLLYRLCINRLSYRLFIYRLFRPLLIIVCCSPFSRFLSLVLVTACLHWSGPQVRWRFRFAGARAVPQGRSLGGYSHLSWRIRQLDHLQIVYRSSPLLDLDVSGQIYHLFLICLICTW